MAENMTTLVIKFIDMGGANNSLTPTTYTELYFNNPNRLKDHSS